MRLRHKGLTVAIGVALIAMIALSGTAYSIRNGQPDGDAHPYVGLLVFDVWNGTHYVPAWRGTGSLISPTVVLTAGHCTDGADGGRVWFDEIVQGNPEYPYSGSTSVEMAEIHTYPGFSIVDKWTGLPGWITGDVGIVILAEPVYLNEYGELPTAGLVDTLPMKTNLDLVGYGVQERLRGGGQPVWSGLRNRFNATAQLIGSKHVMSDEFMRITANPGQGKGGTCYGDSGGPILLAGTNTILGVCSWGTNQNCAGVSYEKRIDIADILNWISGFLD